MNNYLSISNHILSIYYIGSRNERFEHVAEYQKPASSTNGAQKRTICDYGKPPAPGKVCDVDMSTWGQCTKKNKYGYNKSAPCIFLKLNKVGVFDSCLKAFTNPDI